MAVASGDGPGQAESAAYVLFPLFGMDFPTVARANTTAAAATAGSGPPALVEIWLGRGSRVFLGRLEAALPSQVRFVGMTRFSRPSVPAVRPSPRGSFDRLLVE